MYVYQNSRCQHKSFNLEFCEAAPSKKKKATVKQ